MPYSTCGESSRWRAGAAGDQHCCVRRAMPYSTCGESSRRRTETAGGRWGGAGRTKRLCGSSQCMHRQLQLAAYNAMQLGAELGGGVDVRVQPLKRSCLQVVSCHPALMAPVRARGGRCEAGKAWAHGHPPAAGAGTPAAACASSPACAASPTPPPSCVQSVHRGKQC